MQEPYVIMGTGFRNTFAGGQASGFQLNVRSPYYRGTFLSSVDSISLDIDGVPVPADQIRISVSGHEFTLEAAQEADNVRWGFGDPATLRVMKPGGLAPGMHTVQVGIAIRKSYFPSTDPEHLYDFFDLWGTGVYKPYLEPPTVVSRKMTLVK